MTQIEPLVGIVAEDISVRNAVLDLVVPLGIRGEAFASAQEFMARPHTDPPACVILDGDLPGISELAVQLELARAPGHVPLILLTGHDRLPKSLGTMKGKALTCVAKPWKEDELRLAIREGVSRQAPREEPDLATLSRDLVGESTGLRKVHQEIDLVAKTDASVLITGETGTGKELVARAIHERSERRTRPLLTVNCGAIPEALFESELFGHVKGAFSGAVRDKIGYFELADGGTLFLDEIGDVPLPVQVKLLRVLQEQELARVGDTRARKINFRIIAATNRDIVSDVDAGRFRQDLYYRLSVFPIAVPPLRERREDILLLAAHFVGMYAAKMNIHPPQLSKGNIERLLDYHWPGNVRELQNVIERFVIVSQTGEVQLHLNRNERQVPRRRLEDRAPLEGPGIPIVTKSELRERERESIVAALARTNGMVAGPRGAALLLGMKPTTLFSRIKALGIVYDASNPWRQGRQGKTVSASRSQESHPTGGLAGKNGDGKAAAHIRHSKSPEEGAGEGTHPSDEVTDPLHSKRKASEGDV